MEILGCLTCSNRYFCCFLMVNVLSLLLINGRDMSHEVVCKSMDIRNSVNNFRKLQNCTVIEGFLQINLIDNGTPEQYENLSFPALREISGFLFLFRVAGLTNLGKLFPNLVVIRGSVLFHNFALVIFEMSSLQEVGLYSLTDILRGNVKIAKNMDLCYVDTIDWGRITHDGPEGNYIKNNRDHNQCPDTCLPSCPKNPSCPVEKGPWIGDRSCLLCWGPNKCQKVCKDCRNGDRGISCSPDSKYCCSKECLGGCTGPRNSDCLACRHFIHEGKCLERCPRNTYVYLGRRCVTEGACKNMTRRLHAMSNVYKRFKPFQGECLSDCPPGYTDKKSDKCEKCVNTCPKICSPVLVGNVRFAEHLRGCTTINGSLDIQIEGGPNIFKELEKNLKDIQEITGHLKIARSSVSSLKFLRNLRYIRGESLDVNDYSFAVLDNQQLQDLWDWDSREYPLEISRGKIFFHYNGKLCLQKINDLKNPKYARLAEGWDESDVSPTSNGDRVPCDVHNFDVKVFSKSSDTVGLVWNRSIEVFHESYSLLSYVVYYRESPLKNITIFDERDACSPDVWKVKDVDLGDKNQVLMETYLEKLQPYTQYAYYVKAYLSSSMEKGVQSRIQYFQTEPSTPSVPEILSSRSSHPSEVTVRWRPPKHPNGIITSYMVVVMEKQEMPEVVFLRDFCNEAQNAFDFKQKHITIDHPKLNDSSHFLLDMESQTTASPDVDLGSSGKSCCACDQNNGKEKDLENQIKFEDYLHDMAFSMSPSYGSSVSHEDFRRSVLSNGEAAPDSIPEPFSTSTTLYSSSLSTSTSKDDNGRQHVHSVKNVSGNSDSLRIDNLKHFTEYAIQVKACQSVDPLPPDKMGCSINAIGSARTMPLGGADDILDESVILRKDNISHGTIFVKWAEPISPNGLIVAYHVEYKMAQEVSKPIIDCVTVVQYKEIFGHFLVKLSPGKYSLRIRASSIAQPGNWTRPVFFVIPTISNESSLVALWIILPLILLALCVISVGGYVYFKRKFRRGVAGGILYASVNPEYMSAGLVYEPDEWEIPREKISMNRELGQGTFGMVYEGEAKDIQGKNTMKCAIKTVNESASVRDRIEFLQEASVMKAFTCHHVVKLLGVVSRGHPTLVVMELMARGDLKSYLRSHRPDEMENVGRQPPTLRKILQMAIEIADGMAYLAAKKFVHRDLAARNCMVAEDLTVKIGDFGMTRDIYETDYYRKGGKGLLPVRWMAPESLKDGVFTSQSDVWSYGVVLWEMSTLASQPYQGLSNEQVLKYVISGGLMEMPENCPEKLYALMKMCWHFAPRSRPTFSELIEVLLPDVGGRFHEVSFYFMEKPKIQDPPSELVTSSMPFKSPSALESASMNSRDNSDDELDSIQYFPTSSTAYLDSSDIDRCINGVFTVDEGPSHTQLDLNPGSVQKRTVNSNSDGSKGMSLPSSDGSKVSSVSNGSLATGNASMPFASARTTSC